MERNITPKQLEILRLLADGYSSEEIAVKLENSQRTIEKMRSDMLIRVGARNVAHLIAWGFRKGHLN